MPNALVLVTEAYLKACSDLNDDLTTADPFKKLQLFLLTIFHLGNLFQLNNLYSNRVIARIHSYRESNLQHITTLTLKVKLLYELIKDAQSEWFFKSENKIIIDAIQYFFELFLTLVSFRPHSHTDLAPAKTAIDNKVRCLEELSKQAITYKTLSFSLIFVEEVVAEFSFLTGKLSFRPSVTILPWKLLIFLQISFIQEL